MASGRQEKMSAYERRAWDESADRLNQGQRRAPGFARRVTKATASTAAKAWANTPGHAALEDQVRRALEGLAAVTLQPAMNSVNLARVCKRLGVVKLSEVRDLDLEHLDQALPLTRGLYTMVALLEGSVTAVAVTGAEVAATVSAGATVVVAAGAIAADTVASIALMGRIVGRVAAQYGYDVRQPEEEAFALGVISVGTAATPAAKIAALASLSRLTQQIMRRATWSQLNQHALVNLIDHVFKALGFRLVKRRLGQAVPVLGVVLNGGMSAQMADSTLRDARDVYRLRFLTDKYGLDPSAWTTATEPTVEDNVLGSGLDAFSDGDPDVAVAEPEDEDGVA